VNADLSDKLRVYLVTDRAQTAGRPLVDVVAAALRGGVRAVQLRERGLTTRQLVALASSLRELTSRHDALFLVNDRADVALACGADGVHLPGHSFAVADARTLLGPDRLVAASTHTVDEARNAADGGADFVVFGPVFDTPSKRALGAPVGLDALADACTASPVPVLAIGGVTAERAAATRARGAAGVAVIREIAAAPDPEQAARRLVGAALNET
jgi:thiamine-phosphate pyrophosphorylase